MRSAPGSTSVEAPGEPVRNLAFTGLGGERIYVRAFVRERGKYIRSNLDWTREFVAAAR
jgi:hypothetical protein